MPKAAAQPSDGLSLADLYKAGQMAAFGARIDLLLAQSQEMQVAECYQLFSTLRASVPAEEAAGVLYGIHQRGRNLDLLFSVAARVYQEQELAMGASLFLYYIAQGGTARHAFEICIVQYRNESMYAASTALFEQACDRFGVEAVGATCLLAASFAYLAQGALAQSWRQAARCLALEPDNKAVRVLISDLARNHSFEPAVRSNHDYVNGLMRSYARVDSTRAAEDAPTYALSQTGASAVAIVAAIRRFGLCYLRGGCDVSQYEEILESVRRISGFPKSMSDFPTFDLASLFHFDAETVAFSLIGAPASFDASRSAIRKVDPASRSSFTPFHQDTTAFAKRLVNIWVPLTPAGGTYPSLQLIGKPIDQAEETGGPLGAYHHVEIPEALVLKAYSGLMIDIDDARPGDCVIFPGTTIHRSANMEHATETRFNLEIRWS